MTGAETNSSLLPDTPTLPQNNTVTDVGAAEPAEGMPPAEPAVAAPSVTGEQTSDGYPYTQGVDDGRPRTRIVVRPRWAVPDEEVEGAAPAANDQSAPDPAPVSKPERPTDFERERLNWVHSYYRGTVAGAIEQYVLYGLSHLAEGEEGTPRRRAEIEHYQPLYLNVLRDLHRAHQLLRTASVTRPSLTRDTKTRSAAPESTSPAVDSQAFARRTLPIPNGLSPSPIAPRRTWPNVRPFDEAEPVDSSASAGRGSERYVWISAKFAEGPDTTDQEGRTLSDASPDHGLRLAAAQACSHWNASGLSRAVRHFRKTQYSQSFVSLALAIELSSCETGF